MPSKKDCQRARLTILWRITQKYIKQNKTDNIKNLNKYNSLFFQIQWNFQYLEKQINNWNIKIDFKNYESKLKLILLKD